MKKYSKIMILLVLFVLFPKDAEALLCENVYKVKYQELAKNITYSYDATEKNGTVNFTLTFSNVQKGFALKDDEGSVWYYPKNSEIVIKNLKSKTNHRYDVYVTSGGCANLSLYTFNVLLPGYNKYYKDELCNGIEKYVLCQKWTNKEMTYEEWKKNVTTYRGSLNKDDIEQNNAEKDKTIMEKIIEVYGEIYYIVLPILIVVGSIIIYTYNKKRELF